MYCKAIFLRWPTVALAFESAKGRNFTGNTATALSLADAAEIGLVNIDFATEKEGFQFGEVSDEDPQLIVKRLAIFRLTPLNSAAVRVVTPATKKSGNFLIWNEVRRVSGIRIV